MIRMNIRPLLYLFFFQCGLFFTASVVAEEKSIIQSYQTDEEKEVGEELYKSFTGEKAPSVSLVKKTTVRESKKFEQIWDGNVPEVDLSIQGAHLEFQHAGASSSFSLDVEFRADALFLKHSLPRDKKMNGGVLFPWDREGELQGYIPSRTVSGITVFFAPQSESFKEVHRPVMLCVAKPVRQIKSRAQMFYEGHPTVLKSLSIEVAGSTRAKMISGHGNGVLKSEYFVTDGVAPPYVSFDEAVEKDPELSLNYRPRESTTGSFAMKGSKPYLSAGILSRMMFQNAAGYRRELDSFTFLHLLKKVLPSNFPFRKKNTLSFFHNAPCWLLYESKGQVITYSYQPSKE